MNAQQLKNSILQEAIEGRLVPQDPNDEPASVLLDKIRKEKSKLVREGKLKKKDLEEIPSCEKEKPFEIPESWEWVKLGNVSEIARGGSPRPIKDYLTEDSNGLNWIKIGDTDKGGKYINSCKEKIKPEGLKKTRMVHPGDFLLTNSMSFGRPYITNIEGCIHDGWLMISPYAKAFDQSYLYYVLSSAFAHKQFSDKVAGAVVQNLNSDKVADSLIPLPPLAEQKRIVTKIEELLPKVEAYGKAQESLDKLNEELPERLKKSILQEAIEGRLVPQDPNDEPASVLLDKIRKEKAKLVNEGKLKKKDLEELTISEEEKRFTIPKGWEFSKLSFITSLLDGEKRDGDFVCLDAKYLRGKSTGDILSKGKFVKKKDNIILVDGENSGEVFTVPCDGYMGSTFKQLWISESMFLPYIIHFIRFYKDILRNSKKGAAIPHLNKDIFNNLVVGIPPFAEQKRIVAKIEQLLHEIDKLKV